jgi:hypothetical protein
MLPSGFVAAGRRKAVGWRPVTSAAPSSTTRASARCQLRIRARASASSSMREAGLFADAAELCWPSPGGRREGQQRDQT